MKGLKPPHVLLASSNCRKMVENLRGVLEDGACSAVERAIRESVRGLFVLGRSHFDFACNVPADAWRQRISRLYYAAYNIRRAIQLEVTGEYSTDSSDHKNVAKMPDDFPNCETYSRRLTDLREDRNLADYSHSGRETDLVCAQIEYEQLVADFIRDAVNYFGNRGLTV